ncbi:hypothetical protein [Bradyrhizobium sp. CB3481]|uniref:hypothetical protein n=1 Tax=Bradyrhizobium sp. CB3481 TaxID=3039158 RepID=UPI0024B1A617|nr:hypothetical protein [Bradyrhizobium sp. CB3481]WFU19585.1 hypothetical protein QA643_15250 [Bradyrhizobium sp. CB3481]
MIIARPPPPPWKPAAMLATPSSFTIGPIEPAAAVTMAGLPPSTNITRHNMIEATNATLGSTPETKESEITSGISAVMIPASDSRTTNLARGEPKGSKVCLRSRIVWRRALRLAVQSRSAEFTPRLHPGFSKGSPPLRQSGHSGPA